MYGQHPYSASSYCPAFFPLCPNAVIHYLNCWSVFVSHTTSECFPETEQGINKLKVVQPGLKCSISAHISTDTETMSPAPQTPPPPPPQAPFSGGLLSRAGGKHWWPEPWKKINWQELQILHITQRVRLYPKIMKKEIIAPCSIWYDINKFNKNEKCGLSGPHTTWIRCVEGTPWILAGAPYIRIWLISSFSPPG